jgi:DNA-binding beta-propeller fold protein YncE
LDLTTYTRLVDLAKVGGKDYAYSAAVLAAPDGRVYFTTSDGNVYKRDGINITRLVTGLSLNDCLSGLALRPMLNELYVVDVCSRNMISINIATGTHKVVATLPFHPHHIAFNGSAEAFISSQEAIYKWAPDNASAPVLWSKKSGTPAQAPATWVRATEVVFKSPCGLAIDAAGNMLISTVEGDACQVWLVEAQTGKLRLVAGSGECG